MPIYSVDMEITVRIEKHVIADSEEIAMERGEAHTSFQKNALLRVLDGRKHLYDPKTLTHSIREVSVLRADKKESTT